MANFRPLLGDLAGSISDNTFARNRGGSYVRRKTKPVVSQTPRANFTKSVFSNASEAWKNQTTKIERDAWDNYAALSPTKNKLGETIFLTGREWFVAIFSFEGNNFIVPSIKAPIDDGFAPTVLGLLTFNVGGDLIMDGFVPDETNWTFLQLQVSPPVSPTRNTFSTGWERTITLVTGGTLPVVLIPVAEIILLKQYFVRVRSQDNFGRIQGGAFITSIVQV